MVVAMLPSVTGCWCFCHLIVSCKLATVVLPLQDGLTALILASQEGHDVVVETLLKGGATVDMSDEVLLYWPYCSFYPYNIACRTHGILVVATV